MGAIYLGTQTTAAGERRVAMKQLLARGEDRREVRERLLAEARLVFRLNQANICQVIDLAENEKGLFIVFEYVRGLDLGTLLERLPDRRLDTPHAVYIAREVASALDYAHRATDDQGRSLFLTHGDVTPRNTLLSVEGEVKLTDFGIARAIATDAPGNRVHAGTPGFVAPESSAMAVDPRADIYSLGKLLGAMLSGPGADPASPCVHRPDVPKELATIATRATAERPQERYLAVAEVERALAGLLARRYPEFARSTLGELVRTHLVAETSPASFVDELTSITHTNVERPRSDAGAAGPVTQTRTHAPTTPRRWPWVAGLLTALIAAGWYLRGRATHMATIPATVPVTVPVTIPVTIPVTVPATVPVTVPATVPISKTYGYLTVTSVPWGSVYVDGREVAKETPALRLRVVAGAHRVWVFYPGRRQRSQPRRITVRAGEDRTLGFHP